MKQDNTPETPGTAEHEQKKGFKAFVKEAILSLLTFGMYQGLIILFSLALFALFLFVVYTLLHWAVG